MKKYGKLALILTVLLLFVGIFAVCAFADGGETAETQYAYRVYRSDTGKYTDYKSGQFGTALASTKDVPSGYFSVITLLSDAIEENRSYYIDESGCNTVYLDLNGHTLLHAPHSNNTFIELYNTRTMKVYSSKPGGVLMATVPEKGNNGQATLFNLRYYGTTLVIGAVENAPVVSVSGGAATVNYENVSGDNLTTYSHELVTTWYNSDSQTAVDENNIIKVQITGGTHYKMRDARGGLIILENNAQITAKDASFISLTGSNPIFYAVNTSMTKENQKVAFENCFFYGNALAGESGETKGTELTFKNCRIACTSVTQTGQNAVSSTFDSCKFTASSIPLDSTGKLVRINEQYTVRLNQTTYYYYETTETVEKDGTTTTQTVNKINAAKPYDQVASVQNVVLFYSIIPSDEQSATITWKTNNKTVVEEWLIGEDVVPAPSFSTNTASDICRYDFYPKPTSTAATGSAEYTLTPHVSFTLKANLALYSDFVYNMYIPKSAVTSENFNFAKVQKINADGSISESGEMTATSGALKLKTLTLNGKEEEYYVIETTITADNGDANYRLVLNIKGCFGETFEHIQEFSIFDYAQRVTAGSYTENAKTMVNATVTYIKAVRNYFASVEKKALPYPTESNPDLLSVKGKAGKTKQPTPSDTAISAINGNTLGISEKITFVFYFKDAAFEGGKTVTLTYPVGIGTESVTVSKDDCKTGDYGLYYELSLKAINLLGEITVDLSQTNGATADYRYKLSYYVKAVYTDGTTALDMLLDAMWAYSSSAINYINNATSDTPTVEIKIADNTVSASNYVIVANDGAAKAAQALRDAIYAKTGVKLDIASEKQDGKHSISVSLTEPNASYDFNAYVDGDDLVIICGYKSYVDTAMTGFIADYISHLNSSYTFAADFAENYYTDKIYYSDFGAYGIDYKAIADTYGEKYLNLKNWYGEALEAIRKELDEGDFAKIKRAHDVANAAQRHTVCADDGAVYYIHNTYINGSVSYITVQTSVDWGNANFIIDDSDLPSAQALCGTDEELLQKYNMARANIFTVTSTYSTLRITDTATLEKIFAGGLGTETTKINLSLNYPAMIIPYDSSQKVYRRQGYSSWAGDSMHEIIVVDKDGNVDPTTPVMFDYSNVDKVIIYRLDVPELTVNGGTFTTVATHINTVITDTDKKNVITNASGNYMARGLKINRSNTTVQNVVHNIIGEITLTEQKSGMIGAPYNGFFIAEYASDVTFYKCTMQARRCYNLASLGISGYTGATGTYDLTAAAVNNLVYDYCVQSNFWVDDNAQGTPGYSEDGKYLGKSLSMAPSTTTGYMMCWGIGGTNFCKNMVYSNSTLSRFDAHEGLYNGKIINTTINYISLAGAGDMYIENIKWFAESDSLHANSIISLRNDYGCTWNGTVTLKDVDAYHYNPNGEAQYYNRGYVLYYTYSNWFYGYTTAIPNIIIDNIDYYDMKTGDKLTAEQRGKIEFMSYMATTSPELNIHCDVTQKSHPYYPDVDADKDGYVDGTNIAYDNVVSKSGVADTSSYKNLNKVTPPSNITIKTTNGYDYETKLKEYLTRTTLFDKTDIVIGDTTINSAIDKNKDTPIIPYS